MFSDSREGFVSVAEAIPDVMLDIRYYSTFNFIGSRIDGYERPVALLAREAAARLKEVSDELIPRGYRLRIYDAYRPQKAVDHFMRWAEDPSDARMKDWFYPDLRKSELIPRGYIAGYSSHTRGSAVDLTLFDARTGTDLDMGGPFDFFGERSHPGFQGVTGEQLAHRMLLRESMMKHGFLPIEEEWWHFSLADEPYPETFFTFPVR